MVGHGGSSAGSYLADPTSPIPFHCASIVVTSTLRVNSDEVQYLCKPLCSQSKWEIWNLEDSNRAEIPLFETPDDPYQQTFPTGMAIDPHKSDNHPSRYAYIQTFRSH